MTGGGDCSRSSRLGLRRQRSCRRRSLWRLSVAKYKELLETWLDVDAQCVLAFLLVIKHTLPARGEVVLERGVWLADIGVLANILNFNVAVVAVVVADGGGNSHVPLVKKRATLVGLVLLVVVVGMFGCLCSRNRSRCNRRRWLGGRREVRQVSG